MDIIRANTSKGTCLFAIFGKIGYMDLKLSDWTFAPATQITRVQLQVMGQLAAEPDVVGNPTITDNKGIITLANPTFTYIGSGRVHTLNADGTITSP